MGQAAHSAEQVDNLWLFWGHCPHSFYDPVIILYASRWIAHFANWRKPMVGLSRRMRLRLVIAALSVMDELLEGFERLAQHRAVTNSSWLCLHGEPLYYRRIKREYQIRSRDRGRLLGKAPKTRVGPVLAGRRLTAPPGKKRQVPRERVGG